LKSEKEGLETARIVLTKELIEGKKEIESLSLEKKEKQKEIEQIMATGSIIEEAYARLGIIMENVIGKLIGEGVPITALPEAGMKALAGVIILTTVELYDDKIMQLNSSTQAGRIVPVPVLLSEIAGILAPPEVYSEAKKRLKAG
jgi:hypothetical protein